LTQVEVMQAFPAIAAQGESVVVDDGPSDVAGVRRQ